MTTVIQREFASDQQLQRELFGNTSHPATNHLGVVSALIAEFTEPGQHVGDPFAGTGSTGLLASRAGRHSWLQDCEPDLVRLGRANWARISQQTSILPYGRFNYSHCDITEHFDAPRGDLHAIITSPPFHNCLPSDNRDEAYWDKFFAEKEKRDGRTYNGTKKAYSRVYGDNPYNLGRRATYDDYLTWMGLAYGNVALRLRPGGYCAVIVRDLMRDGEAVPLVADTASIMRECGMPTVQIWEREVQLGLWSRARKNKGEPVITTESILIGVNC